jgi:hypothetical protein
MYSGALLIYRREIKNNISYPDLFLDYLPNDSELKEGFRDLNW